MGEFFVYILKSSFCLALFYLFYRLLFTKETFHRFNRIGILVLVLLSVLIPFIELSVEEPVIVQQSLLDLETLLLMATMMGGVEETVTVTPLWIRLLLWGYILGSLFIALLFLGSCFYMFRIIRRGKVKGRLEDGTRLVVTSDPVAPFSWMKWIVISEKDMEEGGKEIINHEMAHIQSRHSLDLLITEICILFHWFNPAVWLFKQELQNIHEYEADEKVLQNGIDAKRYQLLLIKKAVGSQRFTSMANSFNHRSLKKRISMMLKRKSNPWARLKYAFVFPLAALAVAAFARPEISNELEKISSVKISEIVPKKEIQEQKSTETPVQRNTEEPLTGIVPDDVQINPDHIGINPEELQLELNGDMVNLDTLKMSDKEKKKLEEIMRLKEEEIRQLMEKKQVDIEKMMKEYEVDFAKLMQEKQAEIEILMKERQPELEKLMREKQAEIERLIKEKQPEFERLQREISEKMQEIFRSNDSIKRMSFAPSTLWGEAEPLVIIDGTEVESFEDIAPETIENISVLKDEASTRIYGEKGENGVILITTKNANKKINL